MIDPTQNTKRMSSGSKGSYVSRSKEEHRNWIERFSEFFNIFISDEKPKDSNDRLLEHKEKLEKYKKEISVKLKEMEKTPEEDMDEIKEIYEKSLSNISVTIEQIEKRTA